MTSSTSALSSTTRTRRFSQAASRHPKEQILAAYPDLEAEDIEEALHYAADAVRERELPLAAAG